MFAADSSANIAIADVEDLRIAPDELRSKLADAVYMIHTDRGRAAEIIARHLAIEAKLQRKLMQRD